MGSLWQLLGRVEEQLFALAGRAAQLLDWERDHQFCGRCGSAMQADESERAMRCSPCGVVNYPRIAPCVIMLVTRGEELLLAQNINHPAGMYSTLAGFIEAGETVEETLIREVKEEVGLDVRRLAVLPVAVLALPQSIDAGFFRRVPQAEKLSVTHPRSQTRAGFTIVNCPGCRHPLPSRVS